MRSWGLLGITGVLLVPLFIASTPSSGESASKEQPSKHLSDGGVVVPLEMHPSLHTPVVVVRLGDRLPGRVALETTAEESAISESFARAAGLRIQEGRTKYPRRGSGSRVAVKRTIAPELWIGSRRYSDRDFIVHDPMAAPDIDGVLGCDFLRQHAVLCEMARRRMTLWPGGKLSAKRVRAAGFDDRNRIDLTEDGGDYVVQARLNDKVDERMRLATGAPISMLGSELKSKLVLAPWPDDIPKPQYRTGEPLQCGILDTVDIGPLRVTRLPVVSLDTRIEREENWQGSWLGLDVLLRVDFLLDYPQRRAYVKSPERAPGS
jgi:hypothetical protein